MRSRRTIGVAAAAAAFGAVWAYGRVALRRAEAAYPPAGDRVPCTDGDACLHAAQTGAGEPLVLVHGADGTWLDFPAPLVARLAERRRVIALDRPGHGYSDGLPAGQPPLSGQAERVREASRALGASRPIVLAHSYGCALALAWALDHPGEIAGLVLVAPCAYYAWPGWVPRVMAFPATRTGRVLGELLVPLGAPVLHAANARAFYPQRMPAEYRRQAKALFLRPRQFAALAEEYRWLSADLGALAGRYGELRLPVEIVAGDADLVTPSRLEAERLASEVPGAALDLLPGVGHQLHWTHPNAVVTALERLERRLSSAGEGTAEGTKGMTAG